MEAKEIKHLVNKYFQGATSREEERALRTYLRQEELHGELKDRAEIFAALERLSALEAPPAFNPMGKIIEANESAHNQLVSRSPSGQKLLPWGAMQIAAGIILLLVGFGAGWALSERGSDAASREIAALRQEVQQIKRVLRDGTPYREASAGERLAAIKMSTNLSVNRASDVDGQITEILINTMNQDRSVNVRMAAAEALFRFRADPEIQRALASSLSTQEDPLMQITLIDMLVQIKAKGALNEMNKLLMESDTREIVKERLKMGIAELQT